MTTLALITMLSSTKAATALAELKPIPVVIRQEAGKWQLLRGGSLFTIKGVGGTGRMDEFVAAGGNSMRTWGTERLSTELDAAHNRGLTVMAGIWLGHKSYFDYSNKEQCDKQYEMVRKDVLKYRNHPALLIWGLGNEMEMGNDNPTLWKEIERLAKLVKSLDPNHPVSTVIADFSPEKIKNIMTYAPSIDVLGVNSYGGLATVPERLKAAGWTKPYIITEFGPVGPWEVSKTSWGAALEPTSSAKAERYRVNYQHSVVGQPGWCLGSYAFLWGDKQEETPTWFGMFLPTGERTESIDVMEQAWTGKAPKNLAPKITKSNFAASGKAVQAGQSLTLDFEASDDVAVKFSVITLRLETAVKTYAGEGEVTPGVIDQFRIEHRSGAKTATGVQIFAAPKVPGNYRVYLEVHDGKGSAATLNFPFQVE